MKFRTTMLRAPEGDPAGGGGGEPAPADTSSYDTAAANLFNPGDSTPPGDGGDNPPEPKPNGEDGKPKGDGEGNPGDTPPAKKTGLFGKLGKKPADGDTPPASDGDSSSPEDALELAKDAKPETRAQFDNLKKITKEVRGLLGQRDTEVAQLRQQVSKLNELVGNPEDLERIRTEHKTFSDRLSVLDVQNHPSFKAKFGEPMAKLTDAVKTILTDGEVEGVDVSSLLSKSRAEFAREVSKIAENLNDFDADGFKASMRELFQLNTASKDALKDASALREQMQKQSSDRQRGAFEDTWKSIGGMEDFLVRLESDDGASAEERAEVDAYNNAVGSVKADAEQIAFGMSDDKAMSRVATEAATFRFLAKHALPRLEKEHGAALNQIDALTKELAAIKAKRPNPGAGGDNDGSGDNADAPIDYDALAAKTWRS